MNKVAHARYDAYPNEYKSIREGVPHALYQDSDGATVWGPVQLIDAEIATYDVIRRAAEEHQYTHIYWTDDPIRHEPLILDATTAQAMVLVHDTLSEEHQGSFRKLVAGSRAGFLKMLHLTWKTIS